MLLFYFNDFPPIGDGEFFKYFLNEAPVIFGDLKLGKKQL